MSTDHARETNDEFAIRTANRLHSVAIHLLRRLRKQDEVAGISGPDLSALSVIVFGGPVTIGELANAEQVTPPTISRMIRRLEQEGLVVRIADPTDGRIVRVRATARGRQVLDDGRRRRVAVLAARLRTLEPADLDGLERAVEILERVVRET